MQRVASVVFSLCVAGSILGCAGDRNSRHDGVASLIGVSLDSLSKRSPMSQWLNIDFHEKDAFGTRIVIGDDTVRVLCLDCRDRLLAEDENLAAKRLSLAFVRDDATYTIVKVGRDDIGNALDLFGRRFYVRAISFWD